MTSITATKAQSKPVSSMLAIILGLTLGMFSIIGIALSSDSVIGHYEIVAR